MGEHGFTSVDVARVAGQAVIDAYLEAKGTRLKVDLTSPDVVVCVEIRYDRCYVGIDTTGESLHRRGYRVYQHPASLKPSIAYALIRIAEWNAGESLLDPFCGSGTICIEAARFAWRMPNLLRKDTFLFWKLPFLPLEEFRDMILNLDRRIKKGELSIRGCDISPKHIEGAKQNASKADVKVSFYICDATEVELNCDKLIANPPYGLRLGSKYKAARLYRKFEHHLFNSTWERAVILTACPQFFETKPTKRFDIIYGNLPASILVFE
jgi:tRNA (guanine6-N2)-methyltransferase